MQIVFLSNYMNHHQRPFVEHLAKCGCEVIFVAHEKMSEERRKMGYSDSVENVRYVEYDETTAEEVKALIMAADAVIFGWKPKELFHQRVRSGKLTFNYSERLFKKGEWQKYSPIHHFKLRKKYFFDKKNPPYLLSAGRYAAGDYLKLGYPKNRILKWGYFPPLTDASLPSLLESKEENSILWVARFMELKHPEYVVELGRYLKEKGLSFHIKMVGVGPLLEETRQRISTYGLCDSITVIDGLPPAEVRKEFDRAQIALLTSDRREGWGAVINEAMNSACATVGSSAVGSTTYLIKDGVNGRHYNGKKEQLFSVVEELLRDPEQCVRLGSRAYETITELWNYQVAAERMIAFVAEQRVAEKDGPLSRD